MQITNIGSEKGYFITKEGKTIPLAKYKDKAKYKSGDKDQIIHIPDLILIDFGRNEVINIEGKKYKFRKDGISELNNYDFIEQNYIPKILPKIQNFTYCCVIWKYRKRNY